ncbi:MAG: LamG-like jellyroll fold domain-containing protein [Anaerohalosphaeraceae bacterium]
MKRMRKSAAVLMCLSVICTVNAAVIVNWEFNDKAPGQVCVPGERVSDSSGNGRDLYAGTGTDLPEYWDANPLYGEGSAINMGTGTDELIFHAGYEFGDGGPAAGSAMVIGGKDSFTLETMVRLPRGNSSSANYHSIVQTPLESDKETFLRIKNNGNIEWVLDDGPGRMSVTAAVNLHDAKWHHIAAVRDYAAGMAYLYVDYIQVASKIDPTTTDLTLATQDWYVGSFFNNSTREFNGSIDFLRITEGALSPDQFVKQRILAAEDPNMPDTTIGIEPPSVNLSWLPAAEPNIVIASQTVEVASDAAFANILNTFTLGGTVNFVTLNPIAYNRVYYWRVNTAGSKEGATFNNTGLTWRFQTADADAMNAGFWAFDDQAPGTVINAGDRLVDSSANQRHLLVSQRAETTNASYGLPCYNFGEGASLVNPASVFGFLQPGYDFGGGIIAGAGPVIPAGNGNLTIEAVVRPETRTDGGHNTVFSYQPSSQDDYWYGVDKSPAYYFRVNNDGKVRFTFTNFTASRTVTGTTDTRDGWHHIAGVRDVAAAKLRVYVDGVLELETSDTTIDDKDAIPGGLAAIGNFYNNTSGSRTFNGTIDFVKMTRAALTPEQFVQRFELPTNPNPVDGATAVPTTYTLTWTPIADATINSETVVIATDPIMSQVVKTLPASSGSVQVSGLENATVYYWRVDTEGTDAGGAFSRKGIVWSYRTPICVLKVTDGDLDGNCVVDLGDFTIMANNWLASEYE